SWPKAWTSRRGHGTCVSAITPRGRVSRSRTTSSQARWPSSRRPISHPPNRAAAPSTRSARGIPSSFLSEGATPPRTPRPANLARRLVVAQSEEHRVTQLAVAGLFHEADLRHEGRLHPRGVTHARRVEERRGRPSQAREALSQIGERLAREAGADLAGISQRAVVEGADEDRAEMGARAVRRPV